MLYSFFLPVPSDLIPLLNSSKKTFIDYYLLEQDLTCWLKPENFKRLNVFEKILAAERTSKSATWRNDVARALEDQQNTVAFNTTEFNRLFLAAIKGSELDTEDKTGLEAAAAREAEKRELAAPKLQALNMPVAAAAPPAQPRAAIASLDMLSNASVSRRSAYSVALEEEEEASLCPICSFHS